jgi:hypothetical protein
MGALHAEVVSPGKRKKLMSGLVTLGASGAISSQDCEGFSVVKTGSETGRYTITFEDKFTDLVVVATLQISADTAAVQAKGVVPCLRGVSPSTGVALLQFTIVPTAAAAGADAEPEDSAKIHILAIGRRSQML